ncbi:unnamed protein product [Effrenium voratum]|nr:unnamed protein product [Effrenium voratum]
MSAAVFSAMDQNNDGVITREEFYRMMGQGAGMQSRPNANIAMMVGAGASPMPQVKAAPPMQMMPQMMPQQMGGSSVVMPLTAQKAVPTYTAAPVTYAAPCAAPCAAACAAPATYMAPPAFATAQTYETAYAAPLVTTRSPSPSPSRIRASSPSKALSSRAVNGNTERRVVGERHITREELMETGNLVQGDPGRRVTREDPFLPSRGLAQMAPASGASGYEQHASYMAPVTYASAMNQPLVSSAASGAVNYAVSPSANCRNCGNTYAADSNFCRKCGTKRG